MEQTSQTEFEEDGQSKLFLEQENEKTPSEQLFQILSGMENALRPEKKAEWEMVYQERLISLFENPYLSQLQGKTMDGYVAYAIEKMGDKQQKLEQLSLIHISEPTRRTPISYAVFCLKKKKNGKNLSLIT